MQNIQPLSFIWNREIWESHLLVNIVVNPERCLFLRCENLLFLPPDVTPQMQKFQIGLALLSSQLMFRGRSPFKILLRLIVIVLLAVTCHAKHSRSVWQVCLCFSACLSQQMPTQYGPQGMGGYCQQGQPPYFSPPQQQSAAPSQPPYMQQRAPTQQVSI